MVDHTADLTLHPMSTYPVSGPGHQGKKVKPGKVARPAGIVRGFHWRAGSVSLSGFTFLAAWHYLVFNIEIS